MPRQKLRIHASQPIRDARVHTLMIRYQNRVLHGSNRNGSNGRVASSARSTMAF
jgi:hypothetical protein